MCLKQCAAEVGIKSCRGALALMTMWPSSLLVSSTLSTMQDSPGGPFQDTGAGL
jgi:hypothetical protein